MTIEEKLAYLDKNWDACFDSMERYGGSFIKALRQLFFAADTDNRKIILEAFWEHFERYIQMGNGRD